MWLYYKSKINTLVIIKHTTATFKMNKQRAVLHFIWLLEYIQTIFSVYLLHQQYTPIPGVNNTAFQSVIHANVQLQNLIYLASYETR
jgi:hypothetical protein